MTRRAHLKTLMETLAFGGALVSPVGERLLSAQETQARRGMPSIKITKIRTIQTRANAGWSIVKVETSEPGLYGIGSAVRHFRPGSIPPAVEVLAEGLVGPRSGRDRGHLAEQLHELALAKQRHNERGA